MSVRNIIPYPSTSHGVTTPTPTPIILISEILKADGNIRLAAERLNIHPDEFKEIITSDPSTADTYSRQVRLLITTKLLETIGLVQQSLIASLPDLEPADMAKLYTSLIEKVESLTHPNKASQDSGPETLLRLLPPDTRAVVMRLIEEPSQ